MQNFDDIVSLRERSPNYSAIYTTVREKLSLLAIIAIIEKKDNFWGGWCIL